MKIKGSLLLSAPIVKHFWSKNKSRFGPKFDAGFVQTLESPGKSWNLIVEISRPGKSWKKA